MTSANSITDAPLIDLNSSPEESGQAKDKACAGELDIFDSLCSPTVDSLYNNVRLPPALLSNTELDPFDVNAHLQLLNRIGWEKRISMTPGYDSSADALRNLHVSGVFSTALSPSTSSSMLNYQQQQFPQSPLVSSPGSIFRPITESGNKDQTDVESRPSQFHDATAFSKGMDTNLSRKVVENVSSTQINSGGLLYCEPPGDDRKYSSLESMTKSSEASSMAVDIAQNTHTYSGFTSSFREHLANVIQPAAGTGRCNSISLPLKHSSAFKHSSQSRNPFHKAQTEPHNVLKPTATQLDFDRAKTEKAFDWLKDALKSDLTSPQRSLNKSDKTFSCITDVSESSSEPTLSKSDISTLYDSGLEEFSDQRHYTNQIVSGFTDDIMLLKADSTDHGDRFSSPSNQYSNVQQDIYANSSTVSACSGSTYGQTSASSRDNYTCSSNFSDCTWDDEFDDEDFDDTSVKGFRMHDSDSSSAVPPPLPPRTYQSFASADHMKSSQNKPYILPLVRDGQQLSHTHYFLIPSLNQQDHSQYQKDKFSSHKTTAAVKPFVVNYAFDNKDEKNENVDYENLTGLLSQARSLSENSPATKSSAGSGGSGNSSPRHQHHQNRSLGSSPSKPRPIDSQRRSAALEEEGSFMSSSPRDRIAMVQNQVIGVTDDECYAALSTTHWDVATAVKYLKVEQLFRLGMASRSSCQRLLETLDWNLELASSVIIDEVCQKKVTFVTRFNALLLDQHRWLRGSEAVSQFQNVSLKIQSRKFGNRLFCIVFMVA